MTDPVWETPAGPSSSFTRTVMEWLYYKSQADVLVARANQLRERVSQSVRESGVAYEDPRGHVFLDLDTPLTVDGKTYGALKREKRISRTANDDRAREFAEQRDLLDRLFPPVRTFDEQELYVLYQEGVVTEEEIDSLFDEKVSWALKAVTV